MPAIKKFENLDVGDSIYSASRVLSKREIKNMTPVQPLDYNLGGPQQYQSQQQQLQQQQRKPISDREDLVSKLILNLNNINGLFTSLYLVGDDFHPVEIEAPDEFQEHFHPRYGRGKKSKGYKGGMETPKPKKRGPKSKSVEEKMNEIEQLQIQEDEILRQLEKIRRVFAEDRNFPAEAVLLREQKKIRKLISSKTKSITKKQQEEYEDRNPQVEQIRQDQRDLLRRQENERKYGDPGVEREEVYEQLQMAIGNIPEDQNSNEECDNLVRQYNLLTYLLQEDNFIVIKDGAIELARDDDYNEAIQFGREYTEPQQQQEMKDEFYDADADDVHSIQGYPPTPSRFEQRNQIDYVRTGKSTILVILKQIQSLIKQSEQYIKRILANKVVASESDLNAIAEEIRDMTELKHKFPLPIDEESFLSPEIAEYLTKIILKMLDPLIGNLITYLKINAQLNYKQLQEISQNEEVEPQGGLRPQSLGRNLILSDTVRRIHNYDRKYLL